MAKILITIMIIYHDYSLILGTTPFYCTFTFKWTRTLLPLPSLSYWPAASRERALISLCVSLWASERGRGGGGAPGPVCVYVLPHSGHTHSPAPGISLCAIIRWLFLKMKVHVTFTHVHSRSRSSYENWFLKFTVHEKSARHAQHCTGSHCSPRLLLLTFDLHLTRHPWPSALCCLPLYSSTNTGVDGRQNFFLGCRCRVRAWHRPSPSPPRAWLTVSWGSAWFYM